MEKSSIAERKKENKEMNYENKRDVTNLFGGFIFLLILWAIFGWFLPSFITRGDWSGPGEFGDSFGMINSLFSALALIGVIVSNYFQKKEFSHQLREFEAQTAIQREELEHQRQSSKLQISATEEQIALLRSERESREQEREAAATPILMLRIIDCGEREANLMIFNGGSPIFDLKIAAGTHEVKFRPKEKEGWRKILEILDRSDPAELMVVNSGFSGPLGEGYFDLEVTRIDHKRETWRLNWEMPGGLAIEKTPKTSVRLLEEKE